MRADRVLACAAAGLAALAFSLLHITPRLVWNRTESLPKGLYVLAENPALTRGRIVAYRPSASEAAYLEAHQYTGRGWLLVKRIAALGGDVVCRRAGQVDINGRRAAFALSADSAGRRLPVWQGCTRLGPQDVLLLADHPHSVDGRYFGVQDAERILGTLHPVWIPAADLVPHGGQRERAPRRGAR
jgi:conjugative transfer signal peptidase TraF